MRVCARRNKITNRKACMQMHIKKRITIQLQLCTGTAIFPDKRPAREFSRFVEYLLAREKRRSKSPL